MLVVGPPRAEGAVTLLDAEELAGALTDELAALFDEEAPGAHRKSRYG